MFGWFLNKQHKIRLRVWASRNTTKKFTSMSCQVRLIKTEARHQSRLFYVEKRKTASIRASKSVLYVECGECKQHGFNILQLI